MRRKITIGLIVTAVVAASVVVSLVLFAAPKAGSLQAVDGRLAYIRINAEPGSGYGGSSNYVDADVILKLQNRENDRYVFRLRSGADALLKQATLDLLMLAYEYNWLVRVEYWNEGRTTHFIQDVILLERD